VTRRLLLLTAIVLASFGLRTWLAAAPVIPQRQPLADFPRRLGPWVLTTEGVMDAGDEKVLAADDYLLRQYGNSDRQSANLFIAYYRSQRAGESMHSPKNCLSGSGWEPIETGRIDLGRDSEGRPMEVNRFVVEKDGDRALVLYWYQAHGRVIANEYWGKLYLVWDALRSHRRDGALVRIVVPIVPGSNGAAESNAALALARVSLPYLPRFLPN